MSLTGFSLIEVLLTVAILSSVIIFIFRSFAALLAYTGFSQNLGLACYLAEEKLWEIEELAKQNLVLPQPETETSQDKDFSWDYKITPSQDDALDELELSVSWQQKLKEKPYSLGFVTYLLKSKQ
jgi:type II secretion system protein I